MENKKVFIIPESVTQIHAGDFDGIEDAVSVVIPNNTYYISCYAFENCKSLTSIMVSENNKVYSSIDGVVYNKEINTVVLCPNGKETVTIPEGVTEIGESAFSGCGKLTSITIPEGVTKIGDYAFEDCENLAEIILPSSIEKIGLGAFGQNKNLKSITVSENNKKYSSFDGVLYNRRKAIFCPYGKETVTIPKGTTRIDFKAFEKCEKLTEIDLPNSVRFIGTDAFSGCKNLKSITIPRVTKISTCTFFGCKSLTSINFSERMTDIGYKAFCGCDNLISITVSEDNKQYSSFDGVVYNKEMDTIVLCPIGKEAVNIPEGVTKIGCHAFDGCEKLTEINIPNSVEQISWCAFESCKRLTSITIPESVTEIELGTFVKCESLKNVTIPESVTKIADNAFNGCDNITVTYKGQTFKYNELEMLYKLINSQETDED